MRIIARFGKNEAARFVSHLDVQRLMGRALRRADIPLEYSQGFNPHPLLSFATALSVGITSEAEWMDVRLTNKVDTADFVGRLNDVLPSGITAFEAREVTDKLDSLTALLVSAEYLMLFSGCTDGFCDKLKAMLSAPVSVEKNSKSGRKTVDIQPFVYAWSAADIGDGRTAVTVTGRLDASGSLPAELLSCEIMRVAGASSCDIHRRRLNFMEDSF